MQDLSPSEIEAIVKSLGTSAIETTEIPPKSRIEGQEYSTNIAHQHSEKSNSPSVSRIQFTQLQDEQNEESARLLESSKEIKIELNAILGRAKLSLKKLLELQLGSTIALDKLAGEYVDIEANGKLIARGEVVVINNNFGIRITELPENPD